MITINNEREEFVCTKLKLSDLIETNWRADRCAFIGKVGSGPAGALYVVGWDGIILLSSPKESWAGFACPVEVVEYVDLEVKIKRRSKKEE